MKKNFAASILNKIHKKKITPRERYYFIARTFLQVASLLMFLFLGMLSVAMVVHLVNNIEFLGFILDQPRILVKLFWFGVPLFWFVIALALWGVTEKVVEKTDRAYRIPFWVIGGLVFLLQIGGGIVLEQSRVGERADLMFEQRMSWYHGAERINARAERMPENGFLSGKVLAIESKEMFVLNDITDKVWQVRLMPVRVPRKKLEEGMRIHMVGEMISDDEFVAASWRPMRRRPGLMQGAGRMHPPLSDRLREKRGF